MEMIRTGTIGESQNTRLYLQTQTTDQNDDDDQWSKWLWLTIPLGIIGGVVYIATNDNVNETIQTGLQESGESLRNVADNIKESEVRTVESLATTAIVGEQQLGETLRTGIKESGNTTRVGFKETGESARTLTKETGKTVRDISDQGSKVIQKMTGGATEFVDETGKVLRQWSSDIAGILPTTGKVLVDAVVEPVVGVVEGGEELLSAITDTVHSTKHAVNKIGETAGSVSKLAKGDISGVTEQLAKSGIRGGARAVSDTTGRIAGSRRSR